MHLLRVNIEGNCLLDNWSALELAAKALISGLQQ